MLEFEEKLALLLELISQFEDIVLLWVWVSFILVCVKVVLFLSRRGFMMIFSP
jgi:hypothetical protein